MLSSTDRFCKIEEKRVDVSFYLYSSQKLFGQIFSCFVLKSYDPFYESSIRIRKIQFKQQTDMA